MRLILFIFIAGIIVTISLPILILFFIIRGCKNNNKGSISDNQIEIEKQKYNEAQGYYRNQRIKQKENQNQSQDQEQAQSEKSANTQSQDQTQNHNPDQGQDLSKYYDFIEWLKQLQNHNQNQSQNQSQKHKETHYCPYAPEEEPEVAVRDQEKIKAAQKAQKATYTKAKSNFHKKYDNKNIYKCKCGVYVKSKDERSIADFLFENSIPFEYEKESQYFEYDAKWHNLKIKSIHPDFFIKGPIIFRGKKIENVYMEYWGMNTPEYLEIREYKFKIYKHNNCTLINLYPEDIHDCESSLTMKLTQFIDRQINYNKA